MSPTRKTLRPLFAAIETFTATLVEQLGRDHALARLEMVQELIARLPHKYLLAATKDEIRAAGRSMIAEGRSQDEMRTLQSTLMGLLDQAFSTEVSPWHPLRDQGEERKGSLEAPEAALVVAREPALVETVRRVIEPTGVEVHAEAADTVALDKISWFPFSYLLSTFPFPIVPPTTFFETVRGSRSLCRSAGLVLLARDDQVVAAQRFVSRGANRVVPFSSVATSLAGVISELGTVSERMKVRVMVRARLEDGSRTELWQSENLSITGMLLKTPTQLPRGTTVLLEFKVPGDSHPLLVRADVVRHTTLGRESNTGIGVHFLSFEGDGQHRLELFLRRAPE